MSSEIKGFVLLGKVCLITAVLFLRSPGALVSVGDVPQSTSMAHSALPLPPAVMNGPTTYSEKKAVPMIPSAMPASPESFVDSLASSTLCDTHQSPSMALCMLSFKYLPMTGSTICNTKQSLSKVPSSLPTHPVMNGSIMSKAKQHQLMTQRIPHPGRFTTGLIKHNAKQPTSVVCSSLSLPLGSTVGLTACRAKHPWITSNMLSSVRSPRTYPNSQVFLTSRILSFGQLSSVRM